MYCAKRCSQYLLFSFIIDIFAQKVGNSVNKGKNGRKLHNFAKMCILFGYLNFFSYLCINHLQFGSSWCNALSHWTFRYCESEVIR